MTRRLCGELRKSTKNGDGYGGLISRHWPRSWRIWKREMRGTASVSDTTIWRRRAQGCYKQQKQNEDMTVKDLPDYLEKHIRDAFNADRQVVELRTRQELLRREGKYREAMRIAEKLDIVYARVVQEYIDMANKESKNIKLSESGIPAADVDRLLECVVTMFMACDVIESAIMDADDIIHRTDKEMHFEMFNDIRKVAQMAKDKLRFLQDNSGYGHDLYWADKCDNMYEMMRNKARSIIRKRKEESE